MNNPKEIIITIGSRNFFGAERRFLKICHYILQEMNTSTDILVAINYSLYEAAIKIDWAKSNLNDFISKNKLIIIPDSIFSLFRAKGFTNIIKLATSPYMRAVLHGRYLSIVRLIMGMDTVFEVTSIDEARHVIKQYPSFILKRVRCFNCVSETVAVYFSEQLKNSELGQLTSKISFDKSPLFLPKKHSDEGAIQKKKLIVFASRFIERKNPILFAHACNEILQKFQDWEVQVCGKGPLENEIKTILKGHIEAGRATVSYASKIEDILQKSSIYVSLIEPDNYPSQSILEAMHYQNALLLSNGGTSHRFIGEGCNNNGILTSLTKEAIVNDLSELCQDFEKTQEMGGISKNLLEERFSHKEYLEGFLKTSFGS